MCPIRELKMSSSLFFPEPILTPDLLALAKWIAAYYLAPLETVFETMIPAPVRAPAWPCAWNVFSAPDGLN